MSTESYFIVCTFVYIISFSYISASNDVDTIREGSTISCICGKDVVNKIIRKESAQEALEKIFNSNLYSTSILYYPDIIRYHFLNCSMCTISILTCRGQKFSDEYTCTEQMAEFVIYKNEIIIPEYHDMLKYAAKNITPYLTNYNGSPSIRIQKKNMIEYPIYVHVPIGGLNTTREKRFDDWCHYPTSFQASELHCKIYPSKKKCLQKCAFGHTGNKGKQVLFNCRKKENKWKPGNFVDCQPYVDCTLSLTAGGKATCNSATIDRGPVCSVKCHKFEDKLETKIKKTECDIKGRWSPNLPHCAIPGSGLHLESPPKSKSEEEYMSE